MDLTKIRERLKKFENQGKSLTWKPPTGVSTVRLVPYIHNREFPFLELYFYYDFPGGTLISPQSFGEPDPIYEFAQELKSKGDSESWELGRKLEPVMRTYAPVLVRGEEAKGVLFWGFGKRVYVELLKIIDDPDYGDIADPKNGSDLTIEFSKEGNDGWGSTSLRPKRNSTPATTDPAVIEKLKEMPKIEDVWEVPTYEKLQKILENFLDNKSDETDKDANKDANKDADDDLSIFNTVPPNAKKDSKNSESKNVKKETIVDPLTSTSKDAFDQLFG